MTFRRGILFLVLLWAGIYLPALGSLEIKGEEGRRILPGLEMIRTGDWVVPSIAGEPYLRKPPLTNWAVAGSVLVTGRTNEWTVRLPAVVATLIGAMLLAWGVARRHGGASGFVAGVFHLTSLALMEKGRLIEIESIYIACAAGAFGAWIGWVAPPRLPGEERRGREVWIGWLVAGVFLGLGWLAKGPLHLLYFYLPVAAILLARGSIRDLVHPAHAFGLGVMLGIFALWAVPYLAAARALDAGGVWAAQFTGRLSGEGFRLGQWLINFPRGLVNFLPWLVLVPVAIGRGAARESRWGVAACLAGFVVVMLIPESAPRYTFPVLPALMALLAIAAVERLPEGARRVWGRLVFVRATRGVPELAMRSGCVMVAITLAYAALVVPRLLPHQEDRATGAAISHAVRGAGRFCALDLGFQPFEFYLDPPPAHAARLAEVPPDATHLLVAERKVAAVRATRRWSGADEVARVAGGDGREWVVLARGGGER